MELFTKYNNRNIKDRHVDTLIGLAKGLTADEKVNQSEAEFLMSWLVQNRHSENPIILNLLDKLSGMLEDNFLDEDESKELLNILKAIGGEASEVGELSKTSTLPLCIPEPKIVFPDNTFLFTGTFAFGTRKDCHNAITELGASSAKSVTKNLNFLVIGSYVTDSWAHESFGRKIEKAVEYRDLGSPIKIVSEEYWLKQAGL